MLFNIDTNNWLSGVRDILCELGLLNIWYSQSVNSDVLQFIKQRLYDQEKQRIFCNVSNMKNWFIYKHIIDKISLQHYLKKICEIYHNVKIIFSFSIHGNSRYQGINKVNRLRQFCKSDEEDEFHFVLKFPVYDYFQKIVYKNIIELIHPYSDLYIYCVLRILKICVILVFFL